MQETKVRYDEADDNARELIRRTKRATRRRSTPEEKVRIVIEGIRVRYPSVRCAEGKASPPAHTTSG